MTKRVRIENADTSKDKVVVQTWVSGQNGKPDVLEQERTLINPTDMGEFLLWQGKYIVIKEA